MHIVSVIPITRAIGKEELSYYTLEDVAAGDIVTVPLRRKKIPALVTSVSDVRAEKATLRAASFETKKIERVETHNFFLPSFMRAVEQSATYFATTTGAMLNSAVPKAVLTKTATAPDLRPPQPEGYTVYGFQESRDVRVAHYRSLIRELFAKQQSLLVLLPTQTEAALLFEELRRGVPQHTILLHTGMTKKKQLEMWEHALNPTHPVAVVATPPFLSLPRSDIGTLVIEKEHSRHYKTQQRPYTDFRVLAAYLAREMKTPLVLGDSVLRLETLHMLRTQAIAATAQPKMRYLTETPTEIIDMRPYSKTHEAGFQVLSQELVDTLKAMHTPTDRACIFSLRKGLYPLTVCGDCGHLITCMQCQTPVVVHGKKRLGENSFVCHRCNTERSAQERCDNCSSWNLTPLGIGSERVVEALAEQLPKLPVVHIDPDNMTPAQMQKAFEKWRGTEKSILVGTEVILPHIDAATHVAVASMDTLFALPDFRARERMLRILLLLREHGQQSFLVQTRYPDNSVFGYVKEGNVLGWYQEEIDERKALSYPPFSTLIKTTTSASQTKIEDAVAALEKQLAQYEPQTFPAFTPRVRGKEVVHTLITLPPHAWPDKNLVQRLRELSPQYAVHVDPEHLL